MTTFESTPERSRNDSGIPGHATVLSTPRTVDGFAADLARSGGVMVDSLDAGTTVTVETLNSCYRLVVIDGQPLQVLATGGARFPTPTEVHVEGATAGGGSLEIGWIRVGLQLVMSSGHRRITTSTVRAVTLEDASTVRIHVARH